MQPDDQKCHPANTEELYAKADRDRALLEIDIIEAVTKLVKRKSIRDESLIRDYLNYLSSTQRHRWSPAIASCSTSDGTTVTSSGTTVISD